MFFCIGFELFVCEFLEENIEVKFNDDVDCSFILLEYWIGFDNFVIFIFVFIKIYIIVFMYIEKEI